jgi:hypothetical protein
VQTATSLNQIEVKPDALVNLPDIFQHPCEPKSVVVIKKTLVGSYFAIASQRNCPLIIAGFGRKSLYGNGLRITAFVITCSRY